MPEPEHVGLAKAFFPDLLEQHPDDLLRLVGRLFQICEDEIEGLNLLFDLANRQRNWPLGVALGRHIISIGKQSPRTYSELFDALWHSGQAEDARTVVETGLRAFPQSHEVMVKWARLPTMQQEFVTAADRWNTVMQRFPSMEEAYRMGALCLARCNHLQQAQHVLALGMLRRPGSVDLWLQYLETLLETGDIAAARNCWAARRWEFEDSSRSIILGAKIELAAYNFPTARALADTAPESASVELLQFLGDLDKAELSYLVRHFESLGGYVEGCEFGIVQRHAGFDPLGLFRWAEMQPDELIEMLETALDGVGEAHTTIVEAPGRERDDWVTSDPRFGMRMHTFRFDNDTTENRIRLHRDACRRIKFLRRKFLEDVATSEKIFVYKTTVEVLDTDRLYRLQRALRLHGPATLLYVRQPDDTHPAGLVEWLAPDLLVGYIDHFSYSFGPNSRYLGASHECWAPILRQAYRLWCDCARAQQPALAQA